MPRMHCAMAVLLAALIVAWAGVLLEVCEVNGPVPQGSGLLPVAGCVREPDTATLGSFRCQKILLSLRSSCACSTSG